MKKSFFIFLMLAMGMAANSQTVFELVYATSDDGFVNIRTEPSAHASVVGRIEKPFIGLRYTMLAGQHEEWIKVVQDGVTGYARTGYLGFQKWYTGKRPYLVAQVSTPVYDDNAGAVGKKVCTIAPGTIIADKFNSNKKYYILTTGRGYLFIPKECVELKN